jgi:hypothetical protein
VDAPCAWTSKSLSCPAADEAAGHDERAFEIARRQFVPRRQADDEIAMRLCQRAPRPIRPPFGPRANTATARSISRASLTPTGLTSTASAGATDWIAPNWLVPVGEVGSRRIAARVRPGAICLSNPAICHHSRQEALDGIGEKRIPYPGPS